MSKEISGKCPVCHAEKLRLILTQGDCMRITGGPTLRMGIQAQIRCYNLETGVGWCDYQEESAWVDVTLEFGEAIR